jgi:uncharacterized membrane protein (UPF0127 family)
MSNKTVMTVVNITYIMKTAWLIIITLLLFVAIPPASACSMSLPTMDVSIAGTRLKLEIAAQPEARKCGLSKRNTLPSNHGMLFVVPMPIILDFWMADTSLSLSIAFLNETGRILSIHDMTPDQPRKHFRSPSPAWYAIEVNQDWFTSHKVSMGDVMDMQLQVILRVL